ncbi:unnamed protein product [Euphydryas editha]|nr:unnamed protein product [Euphydryas editha]
MTETETFKCHRMFTRCIQELDCISETVLPKKLSLSHKTCEFRIRKEHPRLMFYLNFSYSQWESSVVNTPASFRSMKAGVDDGEFKLPGLAYKDKLPISRAKYNDLQFLKKFCRSETKRHSSLLEWTLLTYGLICLKTKTKPGIEYSEKGKALTFSDLFTLVKETVSVAFKKRDGNLRKKIILSLTVVAIIYGPNHGERIITYMFVRYRLKWDALKYSIYSTYSIITHSIGALFSISVFSKHWGFHDSMLCLISITSKLIGSVYIAFVKTDLEMFMVPLIEILNATTFTSLRSMASKLVLPEEMGKINSLFSLVETLAALLFDPTYSAMYARTIPIFTGAVYIFSAIMTLPPIGILVWFFIQHRRETKLKKQEAIEERIVYSETAVNSL